MPYSGAIGAAKITTLPPFRDRKTLMAGFQILPQFLVNRFDMLSNPSTDLDPLDNILPRPNGTRVDRHLTHRI